jgi:hypothetical protein
MQASSNLSQPQIFVLKSVFTFIRAIITYLEAHAPTVRLEDEPRVAALLDLGIMCLKQLGEAFPVVVEWERNGGVR